MRIPETADFAMESERSSIRWFSILAGTMVVIGVAVALVSPQTASSGLVRPLIAIAGVFTAAMGGVPFKEIRISRKRLTTLAWLKAEAQQPDADLPQLEALLLDIVKKGTS
jgi:hypothetical protein